MSFTEAGLQGLYFYLLYLYWFSLPVERMQLHLIDWLTDSQQNTSWIMLMMIDEWWWVYYAPWFCSFRLWRSINHLLTYLLTYYSIYLSLWRLRYRRIAPGWRRWARDHLSSATVGFGICRNSKFFWSRGWREVGGWVTICKVNCKPIKYKNII